MLDIRKVQAAPDRAAYKQMHVTREERSGRFLGKRHIHDLTLSHHPNRDGGPKIGSTMTGGDDPKAG